MRMNSKQLSILISAVVIFTISELFPPWHYNYEFYYGSGYKTNGRCSAGYSFVTRPPKIKDYNEMAILCLVDSDGALREIKVYKSLEKLNIQRTIFTSIIASIFLSHFARNKKSILALSNTIFVFALAALAFYLLLLYFTNSLYFAK
jgi:hypothetical protein